MFKAILDAEPIRNLKNSLLSNIFTSDETSGQFWIKVEENVNMNHSKEFEYTSREIHPMFKHMYVPDKDGTFECFQTGVTTSVFFNFLLKLSLLPCNLFGIFVNSNFYHRIEFTTPRSTTTTATASMALTNRARLPATTAGCGHSDERQLDSRRLIFYYLKLQTHISVETTSFLHGVLLQVLLQVPIEHQRSHVGFFESLRRRGLRLSRWFRRNQAL